MATKKKQKYEGDTLNAEEMKMHQFLGRIPKGSVDYKSAQEMIKKLKKKRAKVGTKTKVVKTSDYADQPRVGVRKSGYLKEIYRNKHSRNIPKKKKY